MEFYLWHTQRGGWVTSYGTTSTDTTHAARYSADDAIKQCQRRMVGGSIATIPVPVTLVEIILDKRTV